MAYGILKIFSKGILRRILLQLICFLLHFSKKLKKKNKQTKVYDHSGQAIHGQQTKVYDQGRQAKCGQKFLYAIINLRTLLKLYSF